jgi:hypothetical protein
VLPRIYRAARPSARWPHPTTVRKVTFGPDALVLVLDLARRGISLVIQHTVSEMDGSGGHEPAAARPIKH